MLLVNLSLEKAVRDTGLQTNRAVYNRLVQLSAFVHDLDIVGVLLAPFYHRGILSSVGSRKNTQLRGKQKRESQVHG